MCCSGAKCRRTPSTYTITADLTNFAADKMLMGQKVEAAALRVTASNDGYQIKGDVKINGTPATIDLRKKKGDADAELRLQAMIDEAARRRLGIDFGGAVTGAIPVKVTGRIGDDGKDEPHERGCRSHAGEDRQSVAGLGEAGRQAGARHLHADQDRPSPCGFDDLTIDGSGVNVKGSVELDDASDIVSANFPVFSLSDGDKVYAQGRPRRRRRVARGDARRRL